MLLHMSYLLVIVDRFTLSTEGLSVTGCVSEISINTYNSYLQDYCTKIHYEYM